jgi:hypothetical protein
MILIELATEVKDNFLHINSAVDKPVYGIYIFFKKECFMIAGLKYKNCATECSFVTNAIKYNALHISYSIK